MSIPHSTMVDLLMLTIFAAIAIAASLCFVAGSHRAQQKKLYDITAHQFQSEHQFYVARMAELEARLEKVVLSGVDISMEPFVSEWRSYAKKLSEWYSSLLGMRSAMHNLGVETLAYCSDIETLLEHVRRHGASQDILGSDFQNHYYERTRQLKQAIQYHIDGLRCEFAFLPQFNLSSDSPDERILFTRSYRDKDESPA